MEITLKIKRYNPESGEGERHQQYTIDMPEHVTVLDALIQVREYVDGTLALRCSCRSAICGSCAMRIDKQARLACKIKVVDLVKEEGQEILIEPMGNMPVIKDLVTDMAVHWDKVRQIEPWLQPTGPEPEREYLVPNEAMLDLAGVMNCIHCGACVSDCPVLEIDTKFIAPAALAKAYRFVGDPRDGMTKERLEELSNVDARNTTLSESKQLPRTAKLKIDLRKQKTRIVLFHSPKPRRPRLRWGCGKKETVTFAISSANSSTELVKL
ncbi:MAG: succinate dehydrogenase iron-sulfur subunit [Chloroflexi bacterium]|nr:succinate dehydrogenase iron-sulfur subunit [Chloroflexota bacterium]